jgi:hypothetical protein
MKKCFGWSILSVCAVLALATPSAFAGADAGTGIEVSVKGNRCDGYSGSMRDKCYDRTVTYYDNSGAERGGDRGGSGGGGPPNEAGPGPDGKEPPVTPDNSKTCPKTDNPVIVTTGEKFKNELDFFAAGRYGIALQRTYRSMHPAGTMFGKYWLSSLDIPKLKTGTGGCALITESGGCIPKSVTFRQPDGTAYVFTYQGATLSAFAAASAASGSKRGEKRVKDARATLSNAVIGAEGTTFSYSVGGAAATGTAEYTPNVGWVFLLDNINYIYGTDGAIQSISDDAGAGLDFVYDLAGRVTVKGKDRRRALSHLA